MNSNATLKSQMPQLYVMVEWKTIDGIIEPHIARTVRVVDDTAAAVWLVEDVDTGEHIRAMASNLHRVVR